MQSEVCFLTAHSGLPRTAARLQERPLRCSCLGDNFNQMETIELGLLGHKRMNGGYRVISSDNLAATLRARPRVPPRARAWSRARGLRQLCKLLLRSISVLWASTCAGLSKPCRAWCRWGYIAETKKPCCPCIMQASFVPRRDCVTPISGASLRCTCDEGSEHTIGPEHPLARGLGTR